MTEYCKRLIEVDLPIKRISAHAQRDQNIRKGHLHTMHVWWATRPLASCRAVLMATLLPDPVDKLCDKNFREKAATVLSQFSGGNLSDPMILRESLLEFIADFANWDNSIHPAFVKAARELVQAAHPQGTPLVVDPFAGAGSIPFEALRIGADSFAGDLNPVAVLINKVSQEYLPKYGLKLTDAVEKWGKWILSRAWEKLQKFYPKEPDGSIPLAYIWARTIQCEGPGCGAEVPLIGMLWLSRKANRKVALRYKAEKEKKQVLIELFEPTSEADLQSPIVRKFSVTCPVCGYTTPYRNVKEQIRAQKGGADNARLIAVIILKEDGTRNFRLSNEKDMSTIKLVELHLNKINKTSELSIIPDELLPPPGTLGLRIQPYGMTEWGDVFTARQKLTLIIFTRLVNQIYKKILDDKNDKEFSKAVASCLGLAISNMSHYLSSVSIWASDGMISAFIQGSGMAMRPDFAEANPLMPKLVGGFEYSLGQVVSVLQREGNQNFKRGATQQGSATSIPLPDDSALYIATDPPYYNAVPYAELSDICYVWLKRALFEIHPELFHWSTVPKKEECIFDPRSLQRNGIKKDKEFFENTMEKALEDCRRVLKPDGVGVVIFAHKTTAGWEALLNALVKAGWTVTASWPIETERAARMRAKDSAVLASSVHLVCRPRENPDGSVIMDYVGDWREVLQKLPKRIHEWMPRLAKEGIVGADAIFACLGPALEVFSRYSKVEKASGEEVTLREYLEHVWAAVAKEALNTIFEGADAAGFEEDSRLTTMWLWTLSTGTNGNGEKKSTDEKTVKSAGFTLEFDVARRIAQGLGAHLENLGRVVEIKGDKARLLSVAERTKYLFGKDESQAPVGRRKKKDSQMQLDFMADLQKAEREEGGWGEKSAPRAGDTVLDQLHQAMILFAAGRGEAMKRFLVEEGIGRDGRFWRLAQAFSALYPSGTDEKRWVDGVLARKKSLGF